MRAVASMTPHMGQTSVSSCAIPPFSEEEKEEDPEAEAAEGPAAGTAEATEAAEEAEEAEEAKAAEVEAAEAARERGAVSNCAHRYMYPPHSA
nr:hypothetical protein [uncultured Bilophila sp.]